MEIPLLLSINSIDDYKNISNGQLDELASEIREALVDSVSKSGGHLASNLGIVELTLAIHKVYDSPKDRIVFDVGHQAYVHKMLTGRYKNFNTLRKKDGTSGFPRTEEDENDAFNTGHSSTSISAAVGMLRGFERQGITDRSVVAVIGDGALTGGMAFEALNDAGETHMPLVVILNDNGMSISPNVGGLNKKLNFLRGGKKYTVLKKKVQSFLVSLPSVGGKLANSVERLKRRIKYFVLPNTLFEEMGITYLGPIDGHNTERLFDILSIAKELKRPVLVHVRTVKGKGYKLAEDNPEKFHGIDSFDPITGDVLNNSDDFNNSKLVGQTLCDIAQNNEKLVAVSAAMPAGTGLSTFEKKYPERFFDVGIAEQHAVTMAAGMAITGLVPVVAIYSTFLQRAYDQILHDVCLQNLHVVFALDRSGLVGPDGSTHQGIYDLAYLNTMPNIAVMSPATRNELKEMLSLAVELNQPCAIRYPKTGNGSNIAEFHIPVEYGKWHMLKPIDEICVIAAGKTVAIAYEALKEENDIGLINARFIKPVDTALLDIIRQKSKKVIVIEDGIKNGGLFSNVSAYLADAGISMHSIGVPNDCIPKHATINEQLEQYGIDPLSIKKLVNALRVKI